MLFQMQIKLNRIDNIFNNYKKKIFSKRKILTIFSYTNIFNKVLSEQMSEELFTNKNMTQSMPPRSNFQNDIIIPTISHNDNFLLLMKAKQNNKMPSKVYTTKKNRVQSVVQRIVSKRIVEPDNKKPYYEHKLSKNYKKSNKTKSNTNIHNYKPDNMIMDFDELLNEKALLMNEQISHQKQIFKEITKKMEATGANFQDSDKQKVQFYITQISPRKINSAKIIVRPRSSKQVKGWVQQQQQNHRKWLKSQLKINNKTQSTRPRTAQVFSRNNQQISRARSSYKTGFHRNSLADTKLSRYQLGKQIKENIKLPQKNNAQKLKFEELFQKIQENTSYNRLNKKNVQKTISTMSQIWKTQQQLKLSSQDNFLVEARPEILQLLMEKRNNGIKQLDAKFING